MVLADLLGPKLLTIEMIIIIIIIIIIIVIIIIIICYISNCLYVSLITTLIYLNNLRGYPRDPFWALGAFARC